jgi:hypothetical protein
MEFFGKYKIFVKVKLNNPNTGLDKFLGFQALKGSRISRQAAHTVVRLLTLDTGRLYPSGQTPGKHVC